MLTLGSHLDTTIVKIVKVTMLLPDDQKSINTQWAIKMMTIEKSHGLKVRLEIERLVDLGRLTEAYDYLDDLEFSSDIGEFEGYIFK